jgi:hypothetical protein
VDSKDKSLQDVFTKEMHSKFDIDLKGIGSNVDLSLNINSPRKGQTHLMGTMTHDYHGMLRLLKWNNLGKFFYIVLRRVHSWCQISAFKVGTIKTFFFFKVALVARLCLLVGHPTQHLLQLSVFKKMVSWGSSLPTLVNS